MPLIVIIIGIMIFDALGSGWLGGFVVGLLFLVAIVVAWIIQNPGEAGFTMGKAWFESLPVEKKMAYLKARHPDIDWSDLFPPDGKPPPSSAPRDRG